MENIAHDILHRSRSPGQFLPPDTMKVMQVLNQMGLTSQDINPVSEEDVRKWGIPDQCKDFPQLYVEAKMHHQNQRRRRLIAIIRDRVCRNCQINEWREDHRQPLSQSAFMKVDKPPLLHDLLEKQNKRLKVRREEQQKSRQLQRKIMAKMRLAEQRQQSLTQTRCVFKMRLKMRREMTMQKKSMTAKSMQQDMSRQQNRTFKKPQKLSEVQNIIMRTISRQDFYKNTRINERAKQYREDKINEKLQADYQKLRKNMMNKILEHKQSEMTKNMFRIVKAKNQGQLLTTEHLQKQTTQYKQSHRNNVSQLTPLNQLRVKTRHTYAKNEQLSQENRAANAKSTIDSVSKVTDKSLKVEKKSEEKRKPKKYTMGAGWLNLDPVGLMQEMEQYQQRLIELLNMQSGEEGVNMQQMELLLSELNAEWEKVASPLVQ